MESSRGPPAYQPNALPLSQTCALITVSINHNLFEEKEEPKWNRVEALLLTSLTPYCSAKPAHIPLGVHTYLFHKISGQRPTGNPVCSRRRRSRRCCCRSADNRPRRSHTRCCLQHRNVGCCSMYVLESKSANQSIFYFMSIHSKVLFDPHPPKHLFLNHHILLY